MRPYFAKVDYDLSQVQDVAVWDGVIQKDSMWAFAQQGSYKMKLREVYKDYGRFKSQAKKLQKYILKNFEENKQYESFNNILKNYWSVDELDIQNWFEEEGQELVVESYD